MIEGEADGEYTMRSSLNGASDLAALRRRTQAVLGGHDPDDVTDALLVMDALVGIVCLQVPAIGGTCLVRIEGTGCTSQRPVRAPSRPAGTSNSV